MLENQNRHENKRIKRIAEGNKETRDTNVWESFHFFLNWIKDQ